MHNTRIGRMRSTLRGTYILQIVIRQATNRCYCAAVAVATHGVTFVWYNSAIQPLVLLA